MDKQILKKQMTREETKKQTIMPKSSVTPLMKADSYSGDDNKAIRKLLKSPRVKGYFQALQQIDSLSEADRNIMNAIRSMPANNRLIGILSDCGLSDCIIHAIDKEGNIIAHYESILDMPKDLQEGYAIVKQHPDCASVEVYDFTFCVTYSDGTVKLIDR